MYYSLVDSFFFPHLQTLTAQYLYTITRFGAVLRTDALSKWRTAHLSYTSRSYECCHASDRCIIRNESSITVAYLGHFLRHRLLWGLCIHSCILYIQIINMEMQCSMNLLYNIRYPNVCNRFCQYLYTYIYKSILIMQTFISNPRMHITCRESNRMANNNKCSIHNMHILWKYIWRVGSAQTAAAAITWGIIVFT